MIKDLLSDLCRNFVFFVNLDLLLLQTFKLVNSTFRTFFGQMKSQDWESICIR